MRNACLVFFCWSLILCSEPLGLAADWQTCNGTPVRVKYPPMGLFWDQCSIPEGSNQERAFFSALYETRFYTTALGFGSGFQRIDNGRCIIEHDNDRSDVALVKRADIDGALGLTMTEGDGCTFSWEDEHIVTADVMIADDLSFDRSDESRVITRAPAGSGTKIGALAMLHELGHALGLGHSDAFAVMRNGLGARAPFVGMTPNSGGLGTELTGDDVLGISQIYGYDPSYRNVFVSSQLLFNGALIDNNIDPTLVGRVYDDPFSVCAGNRINFFATIGNDSSVRENLDVAVYADSDPNAYFFPTDGPRDVFNISLGRGEFSFPVFYDVPASMPVNVDQFLFVSLPSTLLWDRKAYDNSARSRVRIRRKPSC
jgi:Matrixin